MTLIDSSIPPSRSFLPDSSCFEHGFLCPIDKLYRFTPLPVLFDSRQGSAIFAARFLHVFLPWLCISLRPSSPRSMELRWNVVVYFGKYRKSRMLQVRDVYAGELPVFRCRTGNLRSSIRNPGRNKGSRF